MSYEAYKCYVAYSLTTGTSVPVEPTGNILDVTDYGIISAPQVTTNPLTNDIYIGSGTSSSSRVEFHLDAPVTLGDKVTVTFDSLSFSGTTGKWFRLKVNGVHENAIDYEDVVDNTAVFTVGATGTLNDIVFYVGLDGFVDMYNVSVSIN